MKPNAPSLRLPLAILCALAVLGPQAQAERPATPPGVPTPPKAGDIAPGAPKAAPGESTAKAPKQAPAPDTPEARAKLLSDLYAHLATAEDPAQVAQVTQAIERLWVFSGSPTIDVLMQRAHQMATEKRYDLSLKLLDAVVDLAPDFAEGWNRRAYVYYQQNDFERALGDLRRAVALEPNHFKAIEGIALIFRETGRKKAALKAYQELLQINPHASGAKEAAEELAREVEGQGI